MEPQRDTDDHFDEETRRVAERVCSTAHPVRAAALPEQLVRACPNCLSIAVALVADESWRAEGGARSGLPDTAAGLLAEVAALHRPSTSDPDVCAHCCCGVPDGGRGEHCEQRHAHGLGRPICPTAAIVNRREAVTETTELEQLHSLVARIEELVSGVGDALEALDAVSAVELAIGYHKQGLPH